VTSFETPGRVKLRIALGAGDVRVDAVESDRTEVELVALRSDEATRSAIAEATVEARDRGDRTEIVVELPRKGGWAFLGRGPSVGVRVNCPLGADLEVSTASASVTATGRLGDVEAKTASGELSFDVVASMRSTTASGDVTVAEILGQGEAKTASGDVVVHAARGPLSLNLVSGDVVVADADAALSVATVSGDQQIGAVGAGQVKLQSVSGDVQVGVRPGKRIWLDATSVSGAMTSDLPLEDGPATGGDPEIELRARTVSGDVRIVRAAGVSL
jgi:hypothetical protein